MSDESDVAREGGEESSGAARGSGQQGRLRRHEEPTFGYAITVPEVFVALMNTVDPLARSLRGVERLEPDEESKRTGSWPLGFADPEVVGDLGGDHVEPLRLLEFDVLERADPMGAEQLAEMRETMRDAMPGALAALGLPRFKFLVLHDVRLGEIEALGFEYEWAGPSENKKLRDRGLVVWAPTPAAIYQVYYHCPSQVWDAWLPELEGILASFELIERREPEPRAQQHPEA